MKIVTCAVKPVGPPDVCPVMQRLRYLMVALLLFAPLAAQGSSLDKEMVRRVIKQRQPEYEKCYTQALNWNPGLKGRLLIRFAVDEDGTVSAASEQTAPGDTFPDTVVTGCIVEQFRQLTFPASSASYQVVYPLLFQPKKP